MTGHCQAWYQDVTEHGQSHKEYHNPKQCWGYAIRSVMALLTQPGPGGEPIHNARNTAISRTSKPPLK